MSWNISGEWNGESGGEPANAAPTANAGANQTGITAGSTVTLDFSGSTDGDGTIVSYVVTQTAGDTVALSGTGNGRTFTAPTTGSPQTLTFSLVVTDDDGDDSSPDTVDIGVLAEVIEGEAPVANAGADQTGIPAATIKFFDFGGSSGDITKWEVEQTGGTDEVFIGGVGSTKVFTAPTQLYGQTFTFELSVTDVNGLIDTDSVTFGVLAREVLPVVDITVSSEVEEEFSRLRDLGYVGSLQDMQRQELLDV